MSRLPTALITGALLLTVSASDALARIKLITLPVREFVTIQLDHPEVTLVEEERLIPLVAGVNQVDFAWANTRIDPDSLVFRVLADDAPGAAQGVEVLSVSYPPGENALVWHVSAASAGPARVRIGYRLGGLDKDFHYRAMAERDEQHLTLEQYVRIDNSANEAYAEARIDVGPGEPFFKPLGRDETKEILVTRYDEVPVTKTYTVDPVELGYLDRARNKLNVPMHYRLLNDAAHELGEAALPAGKVRIFQRDGHGGSAFLGEDWARATPLGEQSDIFLGLARDIAVTRTIARNQRQRIAGNLYRYQVIIQYQIENFKDSPVHLSLVEHPRQVRDELYGHQPREPEWTLGERTTLPSPPDAERSDQQKLTFHLDLPARVGDTAPKHVYLLHLTFDNEW